MLHTIVAANRALFDNLGSGWLVDGATAFSVWSGGKLLASWPDRPGSLQPTLSVPVKQDSIVLGELRVTGLDTPAARSQIQAQSDFVTGMVQLEIELNSMAAELIDTRDHLLALYDLIKAARNIIDIKETLAWLARESTRQLKAEGAFVILRVPESGPDIQHHHPEQLLPDSVIQGFLSEMVGRGSSFLCRRGSFSEQGSFRNILLVAMNVREAGQAVLGLVNKVGGDFMSPDIKLAQTIAAYAGAQIENALLYHERIDKTKLQAEMDLARRIQVQLLPQRLPRIAGLDSWATSRPASRVGGDFFTTIDRPGPAFTFAVGDISGKGMPAALLMAMTRTILRSHTTKGNSTEPAGIIDLSNQELYGDFSEVAMFATVFVGQYLPSTRSLFYANAGHSPVVYCPAGGGARLLEAGSTPMGVFEKNGAVNQKIQLNRGDVLVVASDGINEARNANDEMFGYDRLLRLVEELAPKPAREIAAGLFQAVDGFSAGRSPDDDQTVLVLKGEDI